MLHNGFAYCRGFNVSYVRLALGVSREFFRLRTERPLEHQPVRFRTNHLPNCASPRLSICVRDLAEDVLDRVVYRVEIDGRQTVWIGGGVAGGTTKERVLIWPSNPLHGALDLVVRRRLVCRKDFAREFADGRSKPTPLSVR